MQQVVLGGKFIAIQAYLNKQEKSQIRNQALLLKELENKNKAQFTRSKELIKIREEKMKWRLKFKKIETINEMKNLFFERFTKLANL